MAGMVQQCNESIYLCILQCRFSGCILASDISTFFQELIESAVFQQCNFNSTVIEFDITFEKTFDNDEKMSSNGSMMMIVKGYYDIIKFTGIYFEPITDNELCSDENIRYLVLKTMVKYFHQNYGYEIFCCRANNGAKCGIIESWETIRKKKNEIFDHKIRKTQSRIFNKKTLKYNKQYTQRHKIVVSCFTAL